MSNRQSQNFLSMHDNLFLGGPVDQPGNEGGIFPRQQNDRPLGKL